MSVFPQANFQELLLVGAAADGSLVGKQGQISISGNFGGGDVVVSNLDDASNAPIVTFLGANGAQSQFIQAERLTFTSTGGAATDLAVRWFPVPFRY